MAAPVGNKFWELRSKHGRNPIFSSPDELWEKACGYFNWCHDNPLHEIKAFNCGEAGIVQEPIAKMRAMTIQGLCFYLGVSDDAWLDYCKREDFIGICKDIQKVIFTQKFEGVSAGLLSPSLIAKEIGLNNTNNAVSSEKETLELEIKRLELEKIRREINPPAINAPDKDYVVLKPDEDIPSVPIL